MAQDSNGSNAAGIGGSMSYLPKKVEIGQRWEFHGYTYTVLSLDSNSNVNLTEDGISIARQLLECSLLSKSSYIRYLGAPKPKEMVAGQVWAFVGFGRVTPWVFDKLVGNDCIFYKYTNNGPLRSQLIDVCISELGDDSWIFFEDPNAKAAPKFGDYCGLCNTYNEYIEHTGSYVCYGCRS